MDAAGADVLMRWALLVLASLILTGCGASDPVASDDVSAAVEKTTVGSSRISIVSTGSEEDFRGEGVIDYDARRGKISFHVEPKNDDAELEDGEMLFVGTKAYMPTSMFGIADVELTEAPKPWFSFDLAEEEPSLDSLLFPFPYIDPTSLLNALEEVSGEVESLGTKDVRGVETDGHRLTIDLRRAIDEAPSAHREALLEELADEARNTLPIDVWIDNEGFARRVFFREDKSDVTLEFYGFGVEVDVQAPPEDEIETFDLTAQDGDAEVDSGEIEEAPPPAKEDE